MSQDESYFNKVMKDEATLLGDFDHGNCHANICMDVRFFYWGHDRGGFADISDPCRYYCLAALGRA